MKKEETKMRGYKMMESNMTCEGFQYEIGKEYSIDSKLEIYENGFHFYKNPFNCLGYGNIDGNKKLFLVEALGEVITEDGISFTNKIKIIEEISNIEKFFDENMDNFGVNWYYILMDQKLSESFIEKYIDKYINGFEWNIISRYQKLSESFIEKYIDKVNWDNILIYQKLSESFIEKYIDKVNLVWISIYQKLSESFIEKHYDKVNWSYISIYQKLSESFIEKHSDKVNWWYISKYQKLSKEFIEKHMDKINFFNNKNLVD